MIDISDERTAILASANYQETRNFQASISFSNRFTAGAEALRQFSFRQQARARRQYAVRNRILNARCNAVGNPVAGFSFSNPAFSVTGRFRG